MNTVNDLIAESKKMDGRGLGTVWLALLVLMGLAWGSAYLKLGPWNLVVSLAISLMKALLVIWYYMELRESPKIVLYLFGMSIIMALIGTLLTFPDYLTR